MEVIFVPILVALITAGGGALLVQRLRKENTEQHEHNSGLLHHLSNQIGGIDRKVDRLDERLDSVYVWKNEHDREHMGQN
jgi:hypothetical protein